jgi:catechol 2,3-dioxygenase-like lactoylglutathione lyase family enzyme
MRLNQVTVSVRALEPAIAFYAALGLRLIVKSADYARFVCPDGDSTFSLHLDPAARGVTETVVYFEDDALDATVARLKAAGLTFDTEPVDQRWLWREAYLSDPSGNRVCLFQAGTNRLSPPWGIR